MGTSWRLSFETVTGRSAINCNRQLISCGSTRAIFVNVDTPASDHFTVMRSDVDEVTNSNVAYLRLHGRNAKAYITGKTVAARFDYNYNEQEIAEVAERSRKLAKEARELHVIFNNNNLDYAPRAAVRLRKALGQIVNHTAETLELF